MSDLVAFELPDGQSVTVQMTDVGNLAGTARIARDDGFVWKSAKRFDEAMAVVRPVANTVLDQLHSIAEAPEEVHVEFGILLDVKAGAVIAATGAQAQFTVALTWRRSDAHEH